MNKNNYNPKGSKFSNTLRNLFLVFALLVGALINPVLAQRIATSGGTYTIDNTGSNSGTNYISFTDAINDLNTDSIFTGTVIINVAAGQTFYENTIPVLRATGNSGAQIIFQKSGSGSNPVISSMGTTTSETDAAIVINGGDYIKFDGINITASDSSLEFGYIIRKATNLNAATHDTITNCTILMSRLKSISYAILQTSDSIIAATPTVYPTITTPGTNNNNVYTYNTFGNAYNVIWLKGISTTYRDSNNVVDNNYVGRSGYSTGNADIGALTGTGYFYGIYATNQYTYEANYNTIKNIAHSGYYLYGIYTSGSINVTHNYNDISGLNLLNNTYWYIYGIYASTCTKVNIKSNNIHNIVPSPSMYCYIYGIYLTTITTGSVKSNTIQNDTSYLHYGIYSTTANTVTFSSNTVQNLKTTGSTLGAFYLLTNTNCRASSNTFTNSYGASTVYSFYFSGGTTDTLDNNSVSNITTVGSLYCIYAPTATSFRIYNNVFQNCTVTSTIYGAYMSTPNNTNLWGNSFLHLNQISAGMEFQEKSGRKMYSPMPHV